MMALQQEQESRPVACVTGATGYIATQLVHDLLERGYDVRGTVRSAYGVAAESLRNACQGLPGELSLYEADLMTPESFDSAVAGCTYLFHVASPAFIETNDPEGELIAPAVQGTTNVMEAAARCRGTTLRRVVLTSSLAAVHDALRAQPPLHGDLYCEEDWNAASEVSREAYWVSKTRAEQAAWRLALDSGLDLVAICPAFVLGPLLARHVASSTSVQFMKGFLEAGPSVEVPKGSWTLADVRDVSAAHIAAAETPEAGGRYIVSHQTSISARSITDALKACLAADILLPDGAPAPEVKLIDNRKAARELRLALRPPADTIGEMGASMIRLGVASPVRQSPAGPPSPKAGQQRCCAVS